LKILIKNLIIPNILFKDIKLINACDNKKYFLRIEIRAKEQLRMFFSLILLINNLLIINPGYQNC